MCSYMDRSTKFGKQDIIKLEYSRNFYLIALKCFDIILAYLESLNLKEQLQEQ
jgi:hypothetical protein